MNDKEKQAGPTVASEIKPRAVIPGNGTPPPLERAPLAYENSTFLNSPDGRIIRIVSEFLEPLARFRREGMLVQENGRMVLPKPELMERRYC